MLEDVLYERHYEHEESRRIKEEIKREGKEMKVGDIIIEKTQLE